MRQVLLILDDDRVRLRGFEEIAPKLGAQWAIAAWRDAHSMISEISRHWDDARLITLDHDLLTDARTDPDPGSGRVVAEFLAKRGPVCPVIVHSRNTDAAWGMFNVLSYSGWTVELVHHLDQTEWIEEKWLPVARRLVLVD